MKKPQSIAALKEAKRNTWKTGLVAAILYIIVSVLLDSWKISEGKYELSQTLEELDILKVVLQFALYYIIFVLLLRYYLTRKIKNFGK